MEEVLDSQTAKTKSEPTEIVVVKEETESGQTEFENELVLTSGRTLQKYKKNTLLEVVEVLENGNVIVQNEGNESDRWEIEKEIFESTYDKFEVEVAHTCRNKCDSCEFDYQERSCV